jgi:hypothetical protein
VEKEQKKEFYPEKGYDLDAMEEDLKDMDVIQTSVNSLLRQNTELDE